MPVVHGYAAGQIRRCCEQIAALMGAPCVIGIGSPVPLLKASHIGGRFRYRKDNGSVGSEVEFIGDAIGAVGDARRQSNLKSERVVVRKVAACAECHLDEIDITSWWVPVMGKVEMLDVPRNAIFALLASPYATIQSCGEIAIGSTLQDRRQQRGIRRGLQSAGQGHGSAPRRRESSVEEESTRRVVD
jgi:hypothetical protein